MRKYRLSDNYLRFYTRYIEPNSSKIQRNTFALKSVSSLPQWASIMALQFENLVLNNRPRLHAILEIKPEDIVYENPFFQRQTASNLGCQIDYLIQTRFNTLYVCEIKFSKNPVGTPIISEVQQKIDRLKRPKGFSCRPVLIHVNGITEDLCDANYFAATIDFSQLSV